VSIVLDELARRVTAAARALLTLTSMNALLAFGLVLHMAGVVAGHGTRPRAR
jgi:hypothetical protein